MSYRRHNYWYDIAGPTWMYRLFSGETLLYVGVSSDTRSRFRKHRYKKAWWPSVDRVEYRWFPSREAAFSAEREAIIQERPQHNVARPKGAVV